ncbi:ral guanine nucleotide dissociation stimulator-like 1 [Synchiropus splendidus]|uniref:ral guanine nucleotide dissociation stimulator-like 1 n=1 Tax=Synchiropus splendidus TaxID=270530 RepID=UPI00237E47B4|nr:ral guanine nucleotide dissociation stimulator-like 1 [Synchiropus splendidus]XP_053707299.1 ral guanine nucleotide dissociation stimulator-like 1 [Synchiropus splendidus]XP_053707300.1 ral guanine nucleotide dissociation stimulator-like 1 [Synchiropus splendidus]
MGKWELTMNPVQEWGEEVEEGAVYGVTLHREPVPASPTTSAVSPSSAFVNYRTTKFRRLKAARLEVLVEHLLDPGCQEQDYSHIFLSTYRTFTSTSKVLELLFNRECSVSGADKTSKPLLTFVQTWLDEYSEDFRDPPVHPALRLLLDHLTISSAVHDRLHCQPNFCSLAGQTDALLKRFQREESEANLCPARARHAKEAISEDEDSGCENSPDPCDIMEFSAAAIAEQLTCIDSALFVKVAPYQCLGCMWSQRDKKENSSPTIRATIAQFNAVTNQVIVSLLCRPVDATSSPTSPRRPLSSPAQRARVIEKWIRVAQECHRMKNFSSLRAILSALQSNAVYRLRKTWGAVSRDSIAAFDGLWETFPDENCVLTSRELLVEQDAGPAAVDNVSPKISKRCPIPRQMSASGPVVPYLGTYLTVLTMLDTALPDTLEGGLINFEKRRREFEVLSQIRALQTSCFQFHLPQHPSIAAWLQEDRLLTDQQSHELSRQLEPPVDLCSPSSRGHRTLSKKLSFLLTVNEGSKKLPADQISVSSSGSSGSELEDLSAANAACSIRLQAFHSSSHNVSEDFSSSSSCSSTSSPFSSVDSSAPSTPCSSDSQPDSDGGARPKRPPSSHHKRSISMTSLPVYNRQVADSCIVRVSVELQHSNGNLYKSILLTSQDKTAHVIQRALEKHHLEDMNWQDFTLTQVISQDRELLIPDKANVFYAMSTTANFDFVLRHFHKGQKKPLKATSSLGRYTK